MQDTVIPKEVIWVTKILWIDILLRFIVVLFILLTSSFSDEEILVRLLTVSIKIIIWSIAIIGINYFLKKGNKWIMIFFMVIVSSVVISNIFSIYGATQDILLISKVLYFIQILIGSFIIYLLTKERNFFLNKQ
ncbi:MAG: hypothetical protein CJD30_09200 [Sulfuricurvum sp. PD_MW2]|uniref:hypothetical protein n=1 Tax=Sulfuricurvum sp. PD_MW2 TaxID=2027917 RepID=UPI000C06459C|nr:hypothetical protein [Sulfuricurvum sp. PD_MW2]PHM16930.1 MAG: hypothetical protein CJD30_09200 [Sulfuricurvum sp. PD_MW2]